MSRFVAFFSGVRTENVPRAGRTLPAEGISTPGQSRQLGSRALRRTIEIPRWGKPNRTRIPPSSLPEGNGSCDYVWRHVGSPPGLGRLRRRIIYRPSEPVPRYLARNVAVRA